MGHIHAQRDYGQETALYIAMCFMYKYQQTMRRNCTLCVVNVMLHDAVMVSQP